MAVWSEVNSSQVDPRSRFDGEYYLPDFIKNEIMLDCLETIPIPRLFTVFDGNHLEVSKYFTESEDGVPYFRGKDINDFFIDNAKPVKIPFPIYNSGSMKRSHFYSGDVLLSIVGTIGSLSIVSETIGDATGSCKIAILRSKDKMSPYYLSAFLKSIYGQLQIHRNTRGAVQMGLILKDIVRIRVPLFPHYEIEIVDLVKESIQKNNLSRTLYTQAQELLEKELGLDKLVIEKPKSYETSFSEITYGGRFDSEYFSPFVKEIYSLDCFKKYMRVEEIFNIIRGKTPDQYVKEGYPVIKTKNVRNPIINEKSIDDYVKSESNFISPQKGDLILASMGVGSLGRISYLFEDTPKYVVDGTIRVLSPKSDYKDMVIPAMLFLTSIYGQKIMYTGIIGSTGIISLPDNHLKKMLIPFISDDLQKELTIKVIKSYHAKKESEQLLEQAKKRVEELIEGAINETE